MASLKDTIVLGNLSVTGTSNATTIYENGTLLSSKYQAAGNYVTADAIATAAKLGLVKSSTTGTTADRNYNVQVNSDGTMKVNVPWTNTTYSAATQSAAGLMSIDDKKKLDGIAANATKVTSDTISGWGYTKNAGTVTSIQTSGTGISGGTITSTGTITLDSSSAGNAAANKVIIRNAAGSIQTEKLAVSSGTTTKATMQYNSTEDCIEFIFA